MEFGVELARIIHDHSNMAVTELFAEIDREQAIDVFEKIG